MDWLTPPEQARSPSSAAEPAFLIGLAVSSLARQHPGGPRSSEAGAPSAGGAARCWPAIAAGLGGSTAAHPGQERRLTETFPASSNEICSCRGPSAGLAPCSHRARGLAGCVCKHQSPTRCPGALGKGQRGSERQQTVLRGCGVPSPPPRGRALQLIAAVAGVTYGSSRSQRYFTAP